MEQPKMKVITASKINGYFVAADWGPRAETPEAIAVRFFRMIDAFKQIDPVFHHWVYERRNDLDARRDDFADYIKKNIERDDFGVVMPNAGYWFGARTEGQPRNRVFAVRCHVGSNIDRPAENRVILEEGAMVEPSPELHSYRIFHSALLAIVDAWNPATVEANCLWLGQRKKYDFPFRPAWMRYLCSALARQATPPARALVEHLPDGGLLLSATDETFDVDNPQHVSAAEEIAAALAPLKRKIPSPQT
jgi:hypothetical protein